MNVKPREMVTKRWIAAVRWKMMSKRQFYHILTKTKPKIKTKTILPYSDTFASQEWSANLAAMDCYEEESADFDWGGRGWCWDGFHRLVIQCIIIVYTMRCNGDWIAITGTQAKIFTKEWAGVGLLARRTAKTTPRGREA